MIDDTTFGNWLTKIKTGIYGEHIRMAIHDSLESLYENSKSLPTEEELEDQINGIIEDMIGNGDVLKFKGELSDNDTYDLNNVEYYDKSPGIFTIWEHHGYYQHIPTDADDGYYVLVDLSTDETFIVQLLFPVDLTADGTFWIRTNISNNDDYGWHRIGGNSSGDSNQVHLVYKGVLDHSQIHSLTDKEEEGVYILGATAYTGVPSGYGTSKVGLLKVYVYENESNHSYDKKVQELTYVDGSKSWIRYKSGTGNFNSTGSDWYEIAGGSSSNSMYMGQLNYQSDPNTFTTEATCGIYYIPTWASASGTLRTRLPSTYDGRNNSVLVVTNIGTTTRQEFSYVATGSNSASIAALKWHRDYDGSSWSDWYSDAVDQSQIGGIVNDYLSNAGAISEAAASAAQNYMNTLGQDAIYTFIESYISANQGNAPTKTALKNAVDAWIAASGGSIDSAAVYTLIESYISANQGNNPTKTALKNAVAAWDRTYSSDVNQAVTGFLTANSSLSSANQDYISNARSEYSAYSDTIKPAVADGVVGLAAFRMAIEAIKPARSGGEVENSIRSLYATTRDATKPNGWATDWANAYDLARLIRLYNTYYASGDARSELNPLTKAAIADGMLGFAAFKRTEWYPTPQMYGAYGDGQHDDKNAIQLAINANKGKTLYFPAGTYIISSTIQIDYDDPGYTGDGTYPGEHAYTDMIFDPSAVIKAANGTYLDASGNSVNLSFPSAGMISIGSPTYHEITYAKARKRIFKGGVFDSNSSLATSIIRVSQDITDFDISDCVIMATDSTTGLAIGNSDWKKNNEFQVKSMDAYVHHITILKYKYNDTNPNNYDNNNNPKHNRASGLVIYSSDNNFENIRIYYFKRQVKITHGSGNYFSDVHTLGLRYGEADEQSNWYSNSIYHYDTSGFHLENRSTIELDQCYVDSDNYFVYVAKEAAGSVINVNQCTHLQYGGDKNDNSKNTGVGRTMTAFHLGCEDYSNANSVANGKVSQLFIDGFFMAPRSAYRKNTSGTAPDEVVAKGEHTGIFISSNVANGEYFEKQMRTTNMSIKRIRIENPNKLREGDPLKGAMSGEKGTVMLPLTALNRNGTTLHSNWYRIGVIPVGYIDGSYSAINSYKGVINYRVTLWIDECFIEFPLTIGRFSNASNNVHLYIGHGGSNTINTDSPKSYEIAFTNVSSGSLGAYAMWIRLLNGATSASSTYSAKQVQRVHFESNYEVTPAPYGSGTASVESIATLSTRVLLRDMREGKTSPCIRLNCSGKTWSLTDMAT